MRRKGQQIKDAVAEIHDLKVGGELFLAQLIAASGKDRRTDGICFKKVTNRGKEFRASDPRTVSRPVVENAF